MKQLFFLLFTLSLFSCNKENKDNPQLYKSLEIINTPNDIPKDTITEITINDTTETLDKKCTATKCSCHIKHIKGTKTHRKILHHIYNNHLDSLKQYDSTQFKYIDQNYNESYIFYSVKANNIEITQFLLDKGVEINIIGDNIGNALHFAIGNTELASLLIENGINFNLQDFQGVTPIMIAASKGNIDLVKILLDNKADLTLKDKRGLTVVDYSNGMTRIEYNQIYKPIKELLKSHGAMSGYRLREAFQHGSVSDIDKLLKQGICKPDEKDQFGSTCLAYSCNIKKIKLLLEHGLDINCKNQDDRTGLMYSVGMGCHHTVKFYLENGANPNALTSHGYSALDMAKKDDIIELLINHGAKRTKKAKN